MFLVSKTEAKSKSVKNTHMWMIWKILNFIRNFALIPSVSTGHMAGVLLALCFCDLPMYFKGDQQDDGRRKCCSMPRAERACSS